MSVMTSLKALATPKNLAIEGALATATVIAVAKASSTTAQHARDGKEDLFDHLGGWAAVAGAVGGAAMALAGPIALKPAFGAIARPAGVGMLAGGLVGGLGYKLFAQPAINAFTAETTPQP